LSEPGVSLIYCSILHVIQGLEILF
jgi:hypothetical protein